MLSYFLHYKGLYIVSWIFSLLLLVINNAGTFLIGNVVDTIKSDNTISIEPIIYIALSLAIPLLFEPLAFQTRNHMFARVTRDLVSKSYNHVLNLDYDFHTKKQTGKVISVILSASDITSMFVWSLEWFVLRNLAALVIPIALVSIINIKLALLIAGILLASVPFLALALKFNVKTRKN